MTNDNKPPMFGPSFVINPANHEPRSGKSFWMAATAMDTLTGKQGVPWSLPNELAGVHEGAVPPANQGAARPSS
jgi:hypothetical protein